MIEGRPLVLVVEDEFLVQMVAVDLLEDRGFKANAAFTAEEAISFLREHRAEIDVLMTDINLGEGLDGWELARTPVPSALTCG